jgi:hypothetical protein
LKAFHAESCGQEEKGCQSEFDFHDGRRYAKVLGKASGKASAATSGRR